MSYAEVLRVVASLRERVVPRVLAHTKVITALLNFAQGRGGDDLVWQARCREPKLLSRSLTHWVKWVFFGDK